MYDMGGYEYMPGMAGNETPLARVGHEADGKVFGALAGTVKQRVSVCNAQELANTA